MSSPDQTRKIFLIGTIAISALIVVGLVWAIASGPGPGIQYTFTDDNDPAVGPGDAKVTVRVFGDFQCPACRQAEAAFAYAKSTYKDKVRFIWNDFPLQTLHANALPAANAARCAEAQGKFWEYHDMLYAQQPAWEGSASPSDIFATYAMSLGLNKDQFMQCLDTRTYQNKIMDDAQEGKRVDIQATPTFFINNIKVEGIMSNDQWDKNIQEQLKKVEEEKGN